MAAPGPTEFELVHTYRGEPFRELLPVHHTILAHLAHRANEHGDDPFLTAFSDGGDVLALSFRELDTRSRRLASWLGYELDVGHGDVLGLLPANDLASAVAIFGTLRAGTALLLLNPADPPGRLREQAYALGVKEILRSSAVPAASLPEAVVTPDAATLADKCSPGRTARIEPMEDAFFFATSGSTAASKVVAQSHYNAAVNAEAVRRHHRLRRGDRLLGCLPLHHVNGVHFTLFATLAAGAHAILAPGFDPFAYPRLIQEFRPRIASVVPSILEALLETWRRPVLPADFDYFVSAAAPLTARTARAVAEKMNARILQGYGLTEATNFSTTMPRNLSEAAYRRLMVDAEIPSIGTALYGNEVAVLTPDGKPAAVDEIGEICMRGHNVMMCYAGNEAATAEAFRDGWFHSQDVGYEIEDRQSGRIFFVVTGRSKNIAKVRGESVSLDEMERVLRAVSTVQDAACVSLPHRLLGDEIVAAVVLSPGAKEFDLRCHLRAMFSPAALPTRILRLETIPRTPTGKIRRAALARQLASLGDASGAE
jgi:long-chain acyl-CoA synthetase